MLRVSDDDETLDASLRVEVGAWSIVDGRDCTGPAYSGWCRQTAPGGGIADLDGLWFFDTREGLAREGQSLRQLQMKTGPAAAHGHCPPVAVASTVPRAPAIQAVRPS